MATLDNLPQVDIVKKFKKYPWIGSVKIQHNEVIDLKFLKKEIYTYKIYYTYMDNSEDILHTILDLRELKNLIKDIYPTQSIFSKIKNTLFKKAKK